MKRVRDLIRRLFARKAEPDTTEAQMEALRVELERLIEADARRDHG